MNTKSKSKLAVYGVLLLALLFGLLEIVAVAGGLFVRLELAGLAFLLLLSFAGLMTYNKQGERLLFMVFFFYLGNLLLLWYFQGTLYFVLLFLGLLGLVLSIPREVCSPEQQEPKKDGRKDSSKQDLSPEPSAKNAPESSASPAAEKARVKFSPGKYVASKRSNVYHEPKCDWAKKIQKNRQIWFASREEALNKGYKKHSCVQ